MGFNFTKIKDMLAKFKPQVNQAVTPTATPAAAPKANFRRMSAEDVKSMKLKKGGSVKSASARADGIAQRGKTRGKMV